MTVLCSLNSTWKDNGLKIVIKKRKEKETKQILLHDFTWQYFCLFEDYSVFKINNE